MRKFIGLCVVLGAMAGGLGWLAHRGYLKIEIDLSPRVASGPGCCAVPDAPTPPDQLPEEPTPIDAGPVAFAGVIDLPDLPGESPMIVIPEEYDVPPATAGLDTAAAGAVEFNPVPPSVYKNWPSVGGADVPFAQRRMPRCDEADAARPKMPYVADSDDQQACQSDCLGDRLQALVLDRLIELARDNGLVDEQNGCEEDGDCCKDCDCCSACKKGCAGLTPGELAGKEVMPPCEEDRDFHQHYPGCPHAGHCPYSGGHYQPLIRPVFEPSRHENTPPILPVGAEEEAEEPVSAPTTGPIRHESRKPMERSLPKQSGIDTMEFRRSDRGVEEFGPGPF